MIKLDGDSIEIEAQAYLPINLEILTQEDMKKIEETTVTIKKVIEFFEDIPPDVPLQFQINGYNTLIFDRVAADHLHKALTEWLEIFTPLPGAKDGAENEDRHSDQ